MHIGHTRWVAHGGSVDSGGARAIILLSKKTERGLERGQPDHRWAVSSDPDTRCVRGDDGLARRTCISRPLGRGLGR